MHPNNWRNNAIQFPRLISEILATQEIDLELLAQSMDLAIEDVEELFDRADAIWQEIKAPSA